MSESPFNAKPDSGGPKPDDADDAFPLVPDTEALPDPFDLAATDELALPEPVLGSDEDEAPLGFDAPPDDHGGAARSPFLADLEARDGSRDSDLPETDLPETDFASDMEADDAATPAFADPAPVAAEATPGNGSHTTTPVIVETAGRARRVWREIRYVALHHEKPVVEVPPPVVDEHGRLIRKYLFERSFDLVAAEPEPEPEPEPIVETPPPVEVVAEEPPPPVFSEAELAAARAAAHAEGEAVGHQAAAAANEARITELVQQIAVAVPTLVNDRDQAVTAVSHEAARLAHAMVRRLMPELARRYRIEEIEAVVLDSLNKALDQPRIIIRAPADVAGYLGDRLETVARQHGFAGRVIVLSEQNLGPSDVKVEWGDGGAERCIQRAWGDIEATVQRVVAKLEQVAPIAEVPETASADTIGSAA
jgi:flagellar assembly protein FliH